VLAAPTLADVLRRAEVYGSPHPLRDRLVSIVFAEPASLVISDLETNREFWDEMTGESWDLFFAGYYPYGSHGDARPIQVDRRPRREGAWQFSPRRFSQFLDEVEDSIAHSQPRPSWRFSGTADLVSFMVYGGDPDWASLRTVDLCGTTVQQAGQHPLGQVVEGLRRWQDEDQIPHTLPVRLRNWVPTSREPHFARHCCGLPSPQPPASSATGQTKFSAICSTRSTICGAARSRSDGTSRTT
jgi:hypothetical protein